jgi:hypothetical protein
MLRTRIPRGRTAHRFKFDPLTSGEIKALQSVPSGADAHRAHGPVNTTRGYTRIVNQRRAAAVRALPTFAVHQPDSLIPVPPGSSAGE